MQLHLPHHTGRIAVLAAVFVPGAVVGAYLHWMLWDEETGFVLTLGAVAILAAAGLLALIGLVVRRSAVGRVALAVALALAVVGVGLLAGQNLGPSREPLIYQFDGTMTLRLTAPVAAVATGPATCINVASGIEFNVTGDSNMRLETPDRPFVQVYVNVGDRWDVRDDRPRKDGVRLDIDVTGQLVTAGGKPATTSLAAAPSSTIEAAFANAGGSIRFADLVDQGAVGAAGAASPVAGTLEWTCGPVK